MKSEQETLFDIHIGSQIRFHRILMGMSQEKLGKALGVTFQQVQKMEKGSNRIGSGRLFLLSEIFDVPVSFFFDGIAEKIKDDTAQNNGHPLAEFTKRSTLEFMKDFVKMTDDQKKAVHSIVKVIGKA